MKNLLLSAAFVLMCSCSSPEKELSEKGGHSFLLSVEGGVDDSGADIPVTQEEVEQAMRAIEGRLEGMGFAEMLLTREGKGGILLKVPGVDAAEAARISAILEKSAKLELREVSPRNDETDAGGKSLAQRVADGAEIVPGYRAYTHRPKDADGNKFTLPILLSRRSALDGRDIVMAVISPSRPGAVDVTLDGAGTDKMIALTTNMRPGIDRIAIVLDGEVMSAPVVQSVPLGRNFQINGLDEPGEAQNLALSLMHPLGNNLKVQEMRPIPPAGR